MLSIIFALVLAQAGIVQIPSPIPGITGGRSIIGGKSSGESLILKGNASAGVASFTITNAGALNTAIFSGTVNDVVALGVTNSSNGTQASSRIRMDNDAGNIADFALYGTGHSNAAFANRLSINAYDSTDAVQIMANKATAFFRMSLGANALTDGDGQERYRVTTTQFRIGDANAGYFTVDSATGRTILAAGANLGVGVTPDAAYLFHGKTTTTTAAMLLDQATAAQDAGVHYYAQTNAGAMTGELSAYNSSATGTLAGVNKASRVFSYAVGATEMVVGGHTSVPLRFVTNATTAMAIDTSQRFLLGPSAPTGLSAAPAALFGAPVTDGDLSVHTILANTSDAYSTAPKAGLMFEVKYNATGTLGGMGGLAAGKENTTDGDFASYLAFYSRINGGNTTERARFNSAGNFTIGSTTATSMFDVGSAAQFQVNSTGNLVKLNNVTTSFPAANAAGALTNNGSGTFTYAVYALLAGVSGGQTLNGGTATTETMVIKANTSDVANLSIGKSTTTFDTGSLGASNLGLKNDGANWVFSNGTDALHDGIFSLANGGNGHIAFRVATTDAITLGESGGTLTLGSGMIVPNNTTATVLTSLGPTGSHTTVQEWFAIKGTGGATRYVPAF